MAIDPKKLMTYMRYPTPMAAFPPLPPGLDEDDIAEIREELQDDASEAAQIVRLLSESVKYMELSEPAGAFSCATCRWMSGETCPHIEVRAPVSAENGCCNLFFPAEIEVVFPPKKGDEEEVEESVEAVP